MMQIPPTNQTAEIENALLAEVFEESPGFIAILSGATHTFELANKAYYQLVGHRTILGKPVSEALPEVVEQGFIELLDSVFCTGTPYIGKEVMVRLHVTPDTPPVERYVDFVYKARRNATGTIIGIFVHGVDVTELVLARHQSEEQAKQIEQQAYAFDITLTNITDFIYTFDRDGRFTYANKPLLDLLNISLAAIRGKNFYELPYPHELALTLHSHIDEVVATGQQVRDETLYVSPGGKVGYYEYIFSPVFDEQGHVVVVAGSTRDITERIQQERQKDEFLGIVSHELKTPVTSIKAYAQILQKRLTKEGNLSVATHLERMVKQINKLIFLINDLLDMTKISNGKIQYQEEDFVFDDIVAEAIEEVQRTTDQHRIVREGVTNQLVFGDKDRIGQVIINLLTNAVKYSPHTDTILVTSTTDATTITACVRDYGIGMSAEQLPHVFEQFYRGSNNTDAAISGLGLGLYITAEIIRRHGGTIWVESEQDQGSTFCFTLPLRRNQEKLPDIPGEL